MTDPAAALAALRDALLAAGLPPESFRIAGAHEPTPLPTDFWFLRPRWEVGTYERGTWDVRLTTDSFPTAVAFLRTALGAPPPR